jgi:hypothetical protein
LLCACDSDGDNDADGVEGIDEQGVAACDPVEAARPVTLHRLNRTEYDNTVRDLLGTRRKPAADFPDDNLGYGFDKIADVLSVSPLLFEKYLFAAEALVDEALFWPRYERTERRFEAEDLGELGRGERFGDDSWDLWAAGLLNAGVRIDSAGEYAVTVHAFGIQAGAEPAKMGLLINAAPAQTFEVTAEQDAPGEYTTTVALTPGEYQVSIQFLNEFYDPAEPDPDRRTRRLIVDELIVDGPVDAEPTPEPESRKTLLTCQPEGPDTGQACARDVLVAFAQRAWRRAPAPEALEALLALVADAEDRGDSWEDAVKTALTAVLISPRFLSRFEADPAAGAEVRRLDDHELAARLSYFIWSSMPDEALFADADLGRLQDPDVVTAHVRRMLDDPRSQALVTGFADQWLNIRAIDDADPDYERYPAFDEALRTGMRAEMELVFRELLDTPRSLLDLLDSDFTYVDDRLARHYDLPEAGADGHRRVSLPPDGPRAGLFGMSGWLLGTSHRLRTSPVKRGRWVLSNLLCAPPDEPPPSVPPLEEGDPLEATATLRQRMEAHRSKPECAGCHARMDPIGFSLENFDVIGGFRQQDSGGVIDATGEFPDGRRFEGGREMAELLKDDPAVPRCVVNKLFTYALGRGVERSDACSLDQMALGFQANGYVLEELIVAIANSEAFRARGASAVAGGS